MRDEPKPYVLRLTHEEYQSLTNILLRIKDFHFHGKLCIPNMIVFGLNDVPKEVPTHPALIFKRMTTSIVNRLRRCNPAYVGKLEHMLKKLDMYGNMGLYQEFSEDFDKDLKELGDVIYNAPTTD